MIEPNNIYQIDVLDGLKQMEDNSVDVIITSPPYNKAGLNSVQKRHKLNSWNKTIDYGGDVNIDNKPEDEYQKWQLDILKECYRVLKPDGSMFYNHKNRIHKGKIYSPLRWLFESPFLIKQEIIWDRGGDCNVHPSRFIPTTERIYWLTKTTKPRFNRKKDTSYWGEVWRITPKRNTKHPAPFPIDIPDNILYNITDGERLLVLDPFMGSGTVAVSAVKNGCDYIGFELFQEYIDMANDRINEKNL